MSELESLRAIVDYPKTADGVPIYRGMKLWCVRADHEIVEQKCLGHDGTHVVSRYPDGVSKWYWSERLCYSSAEAAEAARNA